MHNFRLWLYLVCGLTLASLSHAQTATVTPVGINSASINSSGQVVSMQTFRATYAGQPDSYYSRAVAYNKATTGKLGKARAFVKGNALNLGIVASTLALGYVLDEITKDIYTVPPSSTERCPVGASCWVYVGAYTKPLCNDVSKVFTTMASACASKFFSAPSTGNLQTVYNEYCFGLTSGGCPYTANGPTTGTSSTGSTRNMSGAWVTNNTANPVTVQNTPTYATDTQIHDAMFPQPMWEKNGYLGDNLPELLRDPVTGAVENTQEVQNVATQIQNQHTQLFNPTATPVTAPTVDPNFTTTTNNPAPTEMPAFCGWASAVCDFMNWFKTDTTTEPTIAPLPQQTLTYTAPEWSSGLGSGSCPSPNTISVLGGSFEISYQPFCTLAEMLKYLVLALAYITSALIISGVKK